MTNGHYSPDGNFQRDGNAGYAQTEGHGYLAAILAKFRAAIQPHIPLGYEDETGFHVGVMPSGENS